MVGSCFRVPEAAITPAVAVSNPANVSNAGMRVNGGGEGADEERATGVAEFAPYFGGAHGLPEPLPWGGGGQVGEPDRGDETHPDADQDRGGDQSGDARYQHRRAPRRGQHTARWPNRCGRRCGPRRGRVRRGVEPGQQPQPVPRRSRR